MSAFSSLSATRSDAPKGMPQTANVAIVAAIKMHESVPTLINCV